MHLVPSWSQNIKMVPKFLKVSNWSLFLLKRLTFAISVKSRLTSLEGVSRVSSSIFWIFDFFFEFFYYYCFFEFFKKNKKIATCQVVIVPRGNDKVMW